MNSWFTAPRATRAAERLAVGFVLLGVALAFAPAPLPTAAAAARAPLTLTPPRTESQAADWLSANPFAASRRPPLRRWSGTDTVPTPAVVVEEIPRLYGTLVGGATSSALLRLDAASASARLYMEGEKGGAYTVRRIFEDRVILDGPSGRIELRLRRGEARP